MSTRGRYKLRVNDITKRLVTADAMSIALEMMLVDVLTRLEGNGIAIDPDTQQWWDNYYE